MYILKRPFDVILSVFGLIMSSLLWALISIVIIIEDGFPVIIKQQRIGKYGKLFWGYKFRSMKKQTLDEKVSIQAIENDPRVTRIGRLLRRCAMDELPQLLNILLGDMSFVGPRALLPKEQEVNTSRQYTNGGSSICDITTVPGFNERILVKPGLTGIAQIWAPRDIMRRQKFKYDLLYIKKMSFWLDLKLILLSFLVTFNSGWERRGAKLKAFEYRSDGVTEKRSTERQAWEKRSGGAWERQSIKEYIINWAPVVCLLIAVFPLLNIANKYLFAWDVFKVFGDTIRVFFPQTELFVLSTLWSGLRESSHFIVYLILTVFLIRAFVKGLKLSTKTAMLFTGLFAALFAMLDETVQMFMADRGASFADLTLDLLAISIVLLLYYRRYLKKQIFENKLIATKIDNLAQINLDSLIASWVPVFIYMAGLFIIGNVLLTNNNTLVLINKVKPIFFSGLSHGFVCQMVGKTRDYSHILIYAILTFIVYKSINNSHRNWRLGHFFGAGMFAMGFGVCDEVGQSFFANRSACLSDWLIDVIGIAVGMVFIIVYYKMKRGMGETASKIRKP